jgi:hypothetical protein
MGIYGVSGYILISSDLVSVGEASYTSHVKFTYPCQKAKFASPIRIFSINCSLRGIYEIECTCHISYDDIM